MRQKRHEDDRQIDFERYRKLLQEIPIYLELSGDDIFFLILLLKNFIEELKSSQKNPSHFQSLVDYLETRLALKTPKAKEFLKRIGLGTVSQSSERELGFDDLSLDHQTVLVENRIVNTILVKTLAECTSESEKKILDIATERGIKFVALNFSPDEIRKSVLEMETLLKESIEK